MVKYVGVTITLLVLFFVSLIVLFLPNDMSEACFDNNCFKLEIAKTQEELSHGLMFREELEQDSGMIFIFSEEAQQLFWMKNMLIPLDIVWLNKDFEVIYILQNIPPCYEDSCPVYGPKKPALYVLELPAGTASRIDLKLSDRLIFNEGFQY